MTGIKKQLDPSLTSWGSVLLNGQCGPQPGPQGDLDREQAETQPLLQRLCKLTKVLWDMMGRCQLCCV